MDLLEGPGIRVKSNPPPLAQKLKFLKEGEEKGEEVCEIAREIFCQSI